MYDAPEIAKNDIAISTRIGIREGIELPRRLFTRENGFVSRKRRASR